MTGNPSNQPSFALLERLDLVLADRLAQTVEGGAESDQLERGETVASVQRDLLSLRGQRRWAWIAGALQLRGLRVETDDVRCVFARDPSETCRIEPGKQEHKLILGLGEVLDVVSSAAEEKRMPSGGGMASLFELMTQELARFRNNTIRGDQPWDAMLSVRYPEPQRVEGLLAGFDEGHDYRDMPAVFRPLHPVRRAFRVFWRFSRISPYPDFNTVFAYVAMTWYLLAHGYPAVRVDWTDRSIFHKLVSGAPPKRFVRLESRMLRDLLDDTGQAA